MNRLKERLGAPLVALRGIARSRDLRRIQLALIGSEVGSWIGIIGLSVVSFAQSGLTGFGVVFGLRMLAPTVAAPFMGLLADRYQRRRVMLAADLSRVVLIGGAAVVVYSNAPLLVAYVLMSLVSVAGTAFRPAQAAMLPSLARTPDELTACNAVSSTIESVTVFAGPAIGGILVAATQPGTAFVLTAVTYLWSAALVFGIHEPARKDESSADRPSATGLRAELAAGARTIVSDRRVGLLVGLLGAQVIVSGALFVYIAGIAFDALHGGDKQLGVLFSALGVGGVLGAAVSFALVGGKLARSFVVGVALWGAPIALLAAWQTRTGVLVLLALTGLANTLVDVAGFTLLQRAVPEEVLARVFGILESVFYGATVIGALVAPALVAAFGLNAALVVTGLFLPLLVVLCWPLLRHLDIAPAPPAERVELLRGVPFLALLAPTALEHLAAVLESVTAKAGETLVQQGDEGDRFFVVSAGEVVVTVDGRQVHEEGPGYYFGEIALLRDAPRMATVIARTDVELLALGRDEFLGTVTGHAPSAAAADAVIASRLRVSRPELSQL